MTASAAGRPKITLSCGRNSYVPDNISPSPGPFDKCCHKMNHESLFGSSLRTECWLWQTFSRPSSAICAGDPLWWGPSRETRQRKCQKDAGAKIGGDSDSLISGGSRDCRRVWIRRRVDQQDHATCQSGARHVLQLFRVASGYTRSAASRARHRDAGLYSGACDWRKDFLGTRRTSISRLLRLPKKSTPLSAHP